MRKVEQSKDNEHTHTHTHKHKHTHVSPFPEGTYFRVLKIIYLKSRSWHMSAATTQSNNETVWYEAVQCITIDVNI